MRIKQLLYTVKRKVIRLTAKKTPVTAGKNIVLVPTGFSDVFRPIFPTYVVIDNVDCIDESDFGKVEIVIGSIDKNTIKKFTSLKWLQLSSVGMNGYDSLTEQNPELLLTNARGLYGIPIAEAVIADILFLFKPSMSNTINSKYRISPMKGKELTDSTIVICGAGDIGRNIAKRCAGMGCKRIIGIDKYVTEAPYFSEIYPLQELPKVITFADVVVSGLPQTQETERLFDSAMFEQMKNDSVFINVGRGGCVDQKALLKNVNSHHLFGAVLDVTTPDPLPMFHPLRRNKRILITDHLACISERITERQIEFFASQAKEYVLGKIT